MFKQFIVTVIIVFDDELLTVLYAIRFQVDFNSTEALTPVHLEKLQKEVKIIISSKLKITSEMKTKSEARSVLLN